MRTRDKASAAGLLPRMEAYRWKTADKVSYRYHPLGGKPISLGTDREAAIRRVLDLTNRAPDAGTFNALWRAYQLSPEWKALAERSQEDYTNSSKPLLRVFGHVRAWEITPAMLMRYARVERAAAPVRANRELALASNLFNLAIWTGELEANPCKQVRRNKERPRKRNPSAAEIVTFLQWLRERKHKQWSVIAAMGEFAARAGSRRTEFLRATRFQIRDAEARLDRAKQRDGGTAEIIALPPDLVALLDSIARPGCEWVFTNRAGRPYSDAGFKAMWSKAMRQALAEKVLDERFTFHDLRAFYATSHKTQRSALPDLHRDPGTTARIYERSRVARRSAVNL